MLNRLGGRLSQTGGGMTEYVLITALIVVVLIVAFGSFGDEVREQVAYQTAEIAGTSKEKGAGTSGVSSGSSQDSPKNPPSNDGKEGKDTPGGGTGVGAGTGGPSKSTPPVPPTATPTPAPTPAPTPPAPPPPPRPPMFFGGGMCADPDGNITHCN